LGVGLLAGIACSSETMDEEDVVGHTEPLTKCAEPTPGDSNFCSDPACPCALGEGDCDRAAECMPGLGCTGSGLKFGYTTNFNVCAGTHCDNKKLDGDETQTDCGGSCGTHCPPKNCGTLPANGTAGHCTVDCKCAPLEGGCTTGTQCTSGQCTLNQGTIYGFASNIGVCTVPTCSNGMKDGTETGIDCGGTCKGCSGAYLASAGWGSSAADRVMDFTYDASGNLIVAGRFSGTINFGTTGASAMTSAGGSDIFVAKFDQVGKFQWSRRFGGARNDGDGAVVVAADAGTGIYVAGNAYSGADFGFGAITASGGASSDAFLVKLTGTGTSSWAKTFGGASADRITSLSVGPTGAVFVGGSYSNTINLGGSTFTAASAGQANKYDFFIAKLSAASGGHSWSKAFGGTGTDQLNDFVVDASSNVILVGHVGGTMTFGGTTLTPAGGGDGFVAKLSSTAAPMWARVIGGSTNNDSITSVAVGANGHPVIVGQFVGATNLGLGSVTPAGTDMFVESVDSATGAARWVQTGGGTGADAGQAVAVDSTTNEVIVSGLMTGTATFSGTMVTASPGGLEDIFVARYSASGTFRWAAAYGAAGNDDTAALGIFKGAVGLAGRFQNTVSFGGGGIVSGGNFDGFLSRYVF
jgi:hypothetical protein